jgi:hypothetical protein
MSAPIASLEEPEYTPANGDDREASIDTEEATFPGTGLACWRYLGATGDALRDRLTRLTRDPGDTSPFRYPGPQPVSIDRSHFETVSANRYAIAPKTDGVRACLLVTDINGVHTVSVWDRTLKHAYGIYIHNVPRAMYQVGTVLDGEVVMDRLTGRWTYLAFDCFIINGLPQYHKPLWDRLRSIRLTLDQRYTETPRDSVSLAVKSFTSLHEAPLPGGESTLESPSYPSDGYILMPVDMPVVFGHHAYFFKLKTCHSVDFVHKRGGVYVFNTDSKRLVKSGVLSGGNVDEGAIVECTLETWHQQPAKRVWRYQQTRTDKATSNTLHTLQKTILNMEENLRYGDIRALAPLPS